MTPAGLSRSSTDGLVSTISTNRWLDRPIEASLYTEPAAGVVKLADTQDLGSCAFGREGSNPFSGTSLIGI